MGTLETTANRAASNVWQYPPTLASALQQMAATPGAAAGGPAGRTEQAGDAVEDVRADGVAGAGDAQSPPGDGAASAAGALTDRYACERLGGLRPQPAVFARMPVLGASTAMRALASDAEATARRLQGNPGSAETGAAVAAGIHVADTVLTGLDLTGVEIGAAGTATAAGMAVAAGVVAVAAVGASLYEGGTATIEGREINERRFVASAYAQGAAQALACRPTDEGYAAKDPVRRAAYEAGWRKVATMAPEDRALAREGLVDRKIRQWDGYQSEETIRGYHNAVVYAEQIARAWEERR